MPAFLNIFAFVCFAQKYYSFTPCLSTATKPIPESCRVDLYTCATNQFTNTDFTQKLEEFITDSRSTIINFLTNDNLAELNLRLNLADDGNDKKALGDKITAYLDANDDTKKWRSFAPTDCFSFLKASLPYIKSTAANEPNLMRVFVVWVAASTDAIVDELLLSGFYPIVLPVGDVRAEKLRTNWREACGSPLQCAAPAIAHGDDEFNGHCGGTPLFGRCDVRCNRNSTQRENKTAECGLFEVWGCSSLCFLKKCQRSVDASTNIAVMNECFEKSVGEECDGYECKVVFYRTGEKLMCELTDENDRYGAWDTAGKVFCRPVYCPALSISNSQNALNLVNTPAKTTVTVVCLDGFRLFKPRSKEFRCNRQASPTEPEGAWNMVPECLPLTCDGQIRVVNGLVDCRHGKAVGAACAVECPTGFKKLGDGVFCRADADNEPFWDVQAECAPVVCPPPRADATSTVAVATWSPSCDPGEGNYQCALIQCRLGHEYSDAASDGVLMCGYDEQSGRGYWKNEVLCVKKKCANLSEINDLNNTVPEHNCDGLSFGDTCDLQCAEGFRAKSNEVKCDIDWNNENNVTLVNIPHCEKTTCETDPPIKNSITLCPLDSDGAKCQIACDNKLRLVVRTPQCVLAPEGRYEWANYSSCEPFDEEAIGGKESISVRFAEAQKLFCQKVICTTPPNITNALKHKKCANAIVGASCNVKCLKYSVKVGLDPRCGLGGHWEDTAQCIPMTKLIFIIAFLAIFHISLVAALILVWRYRKVVRVMLKKKMLGLN